MKISDHYSISGHFWNYFANPRAINIFKIIRPHFLLWNFLLIPHISTCLPGWQFSNSALIDLQQDSTSYEGLTVGENPHRPLIGGDYFHLSHLGGCETDLHIISFHVTSWKIFVSVLLNNRSPLLITYIFITRGQFTNFTFFFTTTYNFPNTMKNSIKNSTISSLAPLFKEHLKKSS